MLYPVHACCFHRLKYGSDALLPKAGISMPAYISAFVSNSVTPTYFTVKYWPDSIVL